MNSVKVEGSIIILNLYDVAEEITLPALAPLIGGTPLSPTFKHPAPEYVRFERPPMIEPMAPLTLATGERFEAALQYYDYGVMRLLLCFPFAGALWGFRTRGGYWVCVTPFYDGWW